MSDNAETLEQEITHEETGAADTPNANGADPRSELRAVEDPFESRARRMGWVAKDDFRGDGGAQWVDAETFVKRAEQSADILIERNKALDRRLEQSEKTFNEYKKNSEKQLKEMSGQMKDLQETLVDFRDFATTANQRAYKKARQDLEVEMRRAVSEADVDRFDAIKARVDELDQEATQYVARETKKAEVEEPVVSVKEPDKETPQADAPPPPPEVQAWVSRNQWFLNPEFAYMNQYAQRAHMKLLREEPGLSLSQNLEKVTEITRKKFPEEFGINPRREEAAVTASSAAGTTRAGSRKAPGYDDLPPEAKAAYEKYARSIPNYSKEEYCRVYYADQDQ